MSRGPGSVQRRTIVVLAEWENEGIRVGELKVRIGGDRSNARWAVRGLLRRGLVEEIEIHGERRLRLTFWGQLRAQPPPMTRTEPPTNALTTFKRLKRAIAEERARLEVEAAKGSRWYRYEHRPARRRLPGPVQERILQILWRYTDPVEEGLPVRVVKAIVGGDRANTRRAIRTLLSRGEIEESEDGRIRLTSGTAIELSIFDPILPDVLDEDRAYAILKAHRGF